MDDRTIARRRFISGAAAAPLALSQPASADGAAVSAVSAAMAASAIIAGGRRIAPACPPERQARRRKPAARIRLDCGVANRLVMPCPGGNTIHGPFYSRKLQNLAVAISKV